jgi:hypothetical protein
MVGAACVFLGSLRTREPIMTIVRLAMALLFVTVLATGCAYYYRVVDTSNGQVYYTTDVAREPNNVRFKDARTGKEMVIPTANVQSITQDEYRAGLGR